MKMTFTWRPGVYDDSWDWTAENENGGRAGSADTFFGALWQAWRASRRLR